MSNDKYKEAIRVVNSLFSDDYVSPKTTFDRLTQLKDEIDIMLDSLDLEVDSD